ncbi:glycosyl hydrolase family 95 catalytic domain-containing protein [Paenibacillus whitsoniae]|uniref:Glycoside hydrolase family 95 protein n=1 Tax=Paenibacillus whitsoniae TaxID=2496558 RepID=A0A3S0CXU7_9BACL|nr:glycoside hydrolase N-terminal domain-containing protein [Paenibacillus whitsoniae]RTE11250.1 glycoside hydrolase family 95 protein [Paenibacillus whitsoniae]
MTSKNRITMHYPAAWWRSKWREALPSGNGRIGAAVYGGVQEETVLLNHEDAWWGGEASPLPDVSGLLPEVRRLMQENRVLEAHPLLSQALKDQGYRAKLDSPLPIGDFKIVMPLRRAFKAYERTLQMETGEVTVSWTDGDTSFERKLFVSRTADTIVAEIRCKGPQRIDAKLWLQLHDRSDCRNPALTFPDHEEMRCTSDTILYAARKPDGCDFGAIARVIVRGGHSAATAEGLAVTEADSVLVLIKLFAAGDRETEWARMSAELEEIPADYDGLLAEHSLEHGRLFHAMSFDLRAEGRELSNEALLMQAYRGEAPAALVEKMWAFGRYLLISSSRANGQPCHLYGLWCGDYDAMWAFHMVNENLQMMYWQALSGNMPELLLAVFQYMERLMDDFRLNAKQLYGCRGIFIPAPTVPGFGILKHLSPHIIHWTGGAGWVAQHYYDYYLYTGDLQFLKSRALPFMREAALFYEDFFTLDDRGYYLSAPSNSPENTPANYWKGPQSSMGTTLNATMDFAIAKELLTHLIEGAELAGLYSEEIPKWRTMLERIPPYELTEDGAVREWMHPFFTENDQHRHQSHVYPVFPGTEITRSSDPRLFQAFVTSIQKRLGLGLKEQTGWSLAHMANNYARMGQGDAALDCLDILSRSCVMNNLMTLHNDWRSMGIGVGMSWAPVQLDANMGWTSAIQEMLLFSVPGELHLMPARPARWRSGSAGPMLARGGIACTLAWDAEEGTLDVILRSFTGKQRISLFLPHEAVALVGGELPFSRKLEQVVITEEEMHLQIRIAQRTDEK